MESHGNKAGKLVVLVLAGVVFLLHVLGLLTQTVLIISAAAATLAALGLVGEAPALKRWLRKLLSAMERRLTGLWEKTKQGTSS